MSLSFCCIRHSQILYSLIIEKIIKSSGDSSTAAPQVEMPKNYGKSPEEVDDFFNKVILDSCSLYPPPAPETNNSTGEVHLTAPSSVARYPPNYSKDNSLLSSSSSSLSSFARNDALQSSRDPSSSSRGDLTLKNFKSICCDSSSSSSYSGSRKNSNIKSYKDNIITIHLPGLDTQELSFLSQNFKSVSTEEEIKSDAKDDILWDFNDVVLKSPGMVNNLMEIMNQHYYVKRNAVLKIKERQYHSFSMLQPVSEKGFNMVVFPSSHKYSREYVRYHSAYGIRLFIPNYCGVLFLDDLMHAGGKVRYGDTGQFLRDPRIFFYVQQVGLNPTDTKRVDQADTRSGCSMCPVGNVIPKPRQMCYNLVDKEHVCEECDKFSPMGEKVIDVAAVFGEDKVRKKKFGKVIFGDLDMFGFVVFRSKAPSNKVQAEVGNQIHSLKGDQLDDQPHRRVMYSYGTRDASTPNVNTENDAIDSFTKTVFNKMEKSILKDANYRMLKPNLIWNNGIIEIDQLPHFDYPEEIELSK